MMEQVDLFLLLWKWQAAQIKVLVLRKLISNLKIDSCSLQKVLKCKPAFPASIVKTTISLRFLWLSLFKRCNICFLQETYSTYTIEYIQVKISAASLQLARIYARSTHCDLDEIINSLRDELNIFISCTFALLIFSILALLSFLINTLGPYVLCSLFFPFAFVILWSFNLVCQCMYYK